METFSPPPIASIDSVNYYNTDEEEYRTVDSTTTITSTTALPFFSTPVLFVDNNENNNNYDVSKSNFATIIEKIVVATSPEPSKSFSSSLAGSSDFIYNNNLTHTASTSSSSSALAQLMLNAAAAGSSRNKSELPEYMRFSHANVVEITLLSILFVIGLIGNATILMALVKHRSTNSRRSRITFLMLNLAVSDMLVVCVTIPIRLIWSATVQWRGDDLSCRVCMFARIFGIYLSSFILVAISIDRYLTIVYPFSSVTKAEKAAKVMVYGAWIATALSSLPQLFVFRLQQHPQFEDYWQCITYGNFPSPIIELVYNIFTMLMTYALPLTIIIFCYWRILLTLHKQTRAAKKQRHQQRSPAAIVAAGVLTAGVLSNHHQLNPNVTSFPSSAGERSMLLRTSSRPNGITHHNLHQNFSFRSKWHHDNDIGAKNNHRNNNKKPSLNNNEDVIEDLSEKRHESTAPNGFCHVNDSSRNLPKIPIIIEHLHEHSDQNSASLVDNNNNSSGNCATGSVDVMEKSNVENTTAAVATNGNHKTVSSPDSATSTTDCSSNGSNYNNNNSKCLKSTTTTNHSQSAAGGQDDDAVVRKREKRLSSVWLSSLRCPCCGKGRKRNRRRNGSGRDVPLIKTTHCEADSMRYATSTSHQSTFRRMLSIAHANSGDEPTTSSSAIVALAESAGGLLVVPDDDSDSGLRRSQNITLLRAKSKTLKMAIILVLVFILCWSPYYLMSFWYWVHPSSASTIASWELQVCLFCFAVSNACLNPVVYGIFNQPVVHDIKDVFPFCALKFLFHSLDGRNKSHLPSPSSHYVLNHHNNANHHNNNTPTTSTTTTSPFATARAAPTIRRGETAKSFRHTSHHGTNGQPKQLAATQQFHRAASMRYSSPTAAVASSQFVRLHKQTSHETPLPLHQQALLNDHISCNGGPLPKNTAADKKRAQTNGRFSPMQDGRRLPPKAEMEEFSSMELL